jgi:hypothetical protein
MGHPKQNVRRWFQKEGEGGKREYSSRVQGKERERGRWGMR